MTAEFYLQTVDTVFQRNLLPKGRKQYFLAKDVGHYGIFNGRKWRERIAPVVEKFISEND